MEQALGLPLEKLEERARNCVTCFLETLFDPEEKGLRHYYRADQKYYSELDSGNFLMAVNYLTIYDMTGDPHLLERAEDCFHWAYADWLLAHQNEEGAWPIGIDTDDEVCAPNIGPGDMPNIAMGLLRLHRDTGNDAYLLCRVPSRFPVRQVKTRFHKKRSPSG